MVVNTCSFIQAATEESIDVIFEICGLDNFSSGSAKLIVAGCMPARYGDDLQDELQEAQAFVPCSREDDIVEVLCGVLGVCPQTPSDGFVSPYAVSAASYVKISDGCDRFCSFCAIPYIRGRYHSFSYEEVRAAVAERVDEGVREITLIAQDTGRWGEDFENPSTTARLLDGLASEFSDTWFRLMYIEPQGVTDELLDVISAHDNVCSYLDVPLQHASESVLRAMNRRGSAKSHRELIERIRLRVPDITLRTTLIAGFRGRRRRISRNSANSSKRSNSITSACSRTLGRKALVRRISGQVDEEVKIERAQRIRDISDAIGESHVSAHIGKTMDVLVLGREEDGQLFGRAMCQAPEVDGVVYLEEGTVGDIVKVRIEDTLVDEMEGEVVHGE